jgi:CHAD domain-containing protein
VLGQLDIAIELLSGGVDAADVTSAEAVHETRKAIKRLRATIRLLEGELGRKRAGRERKLLRDVAKSLAGARDAEVMVQTLDGLLGRHPRKLGRRRALEELRSHLERERAAAAAQAERDASTRARALADLRRLRGRVAGWRLKGRSRGRLTGPGLERIYRSGRGEHRRVWVSKPAARAWHRWRKHVKDLRYALEAIDVKEGKSSAGRVAKLAKRADSLGEALGEERDLMLLAELARAHRPLKRYPRARKRLLKAIAKRRAKLRAQALREGERLFERKPKRFVKRVLANR